jgi:ferredoxin--NADP+ reductase
VIGTNKKCAHETVAALLEDLEAGELPEPSPDVEAFDRLLDEHCPDRVDYAGWQRIDEHERAAGEPHGRPRVKVVRREELAARGSRAGSAR